MADRIELDRSDEQPCMRCERKGVLDTGWECTECGYDNMPWYYPEGVARLDANAAAPKLAGEVPGE